MALPLEARINILEQTVYDLQNHIVQLQKQIQELTPVEQEQKPLIVGTKYSKVKGINNLNKTVILQDVTYIGTYCSNYYVFTHSSINHEFYIYKHSCTYTPSVVDREVYLV